LATSYTGEQPPVYTIINFQVKGAKYSESFYFYSDKTFRMFKNHLRGEVDYSKVVAFEDICKVMFRISPHGFNVATVGTRDIITVVFPGEHLAAWMDYNMCPNDEYVSMEPTKIKELARLTQTKNSSGI